MNTIRRAVLAATFLLAATAAAASETGVARLVSVSGNVLVSSDSRIASADTAVRLAPGARVLATANGQAIVEFDGGCRVKVEAGQRFTIRADACLAQPDRSMRFAEVSPAR